MWREGVEEGEGIFWLHGMELGGGRPSRGSSLLFHRLLWSEGSSQVAREEPPAAQLSGDESSATVSASPDEGLDERDKRWDGLKKRYQTAKYSLATQRAALKNRVVVFDSTRTVGNLVEVFVTVGLSPSWGESRCLSIRTTSVPAAAEEVAGPNPM